MEKKSRRREKERERKKKKGGKKGEGGREIFESCKGPWPAEFTQSGWVKYIFTLVFVTAYWSTADAESKVPAVEKTDLSTYLKLLFKISQASRRCVCPRFIYIQI